MAKKELLDTYLGIKTTEKMKNDLIKLAAKEDREFSDYIRLQWKRLIEEAKVGKRGK